jgi:hypothetical protein
VVGRWLEGLHHGVGNEQRHPAGLAVLERRSEHPAEIVLGGHVRDRVVHEHRVERPPQPNRTHVALEVLALGVEPAAHVEHLRRAVDKRELERRLHVGRVVAAARTELDDRPRLTVRRLEDQARVLGRLFGVVVRCREQRPPVGELPIEPG